MKGKNTNWLKKDRIVKLRREKKKKYNESSKKKSSMGPPILISWNIARSHLITVESKLSCFVF